MSVDDGLRYCTETTHHHISFVDNLLVTELKDQWPEIDVRPQSVQKSTIACSPLSRGTVEMRGLLWGGIIDLSLRIVRTYCNSFKIVTVIGSQLKGKGYVIIIVLEAQLEWRTTLIRLGV